MQFSLLASLEIYYRIRVSIYPNSGDGLRIIACESQIEVLLPSHATNIRDCEELADHGVSEVSGIQRAPEIL